MSYNNGPKIVTDGLVLMLDPIISKSYPGSGNTVYDLSGRGNNGTINGATYWSDGRGCFNFDGVNDNINSITYPVDNPQNGSIETWIKFTNGTDLSSQNLQVYMIPCYNSLYLYFYRNAHWTANQLSNFLYYRKASDGTTGANIPVYSALSYSVNTWYQNVFIWKSDGTAQIYKNGTLADSRTMTDFDYWYAPNGNNFSLSNNYTFEGNIASYKIYNKALSANEVSQNYNATKYRFGL